MDISYIKKQNRLAVDILEQRQTKGIPTALVHIMQHNYIERLAGAEPGAYKREPEKTYLAMQRNIGINMLDQYIPTNPLEMGERGYEGINAAHHETGETVCDGMVIDSPEAVAEHLERFEFPRLTAGIESFDEDRQTADIIKKEYEIQEKLGEGILKTGYGFIGFPKMRYSQYGYVNYFMAYALYPEIMERDFKLQADSCLKNNRAAARAYKEGKLPPLYRLDHDIADSRGTLVDIKSLDRIWLTQVARCLEPVLKTGVRMIWHCDGNLMQMVPRLLDIGIKGFQGFQYEDGMDYEKICKMKTKEGDDLIIEAGISVTRTLPFGTPADIKKEMEFLVENGPKTGLILSASSSVTPGIRWANISAMLEGFKYYRENGR